jgi:two-component system OmpR family sensor kinase
VTRQRWYHTLYWRFAIGFVVFLAAMLVVQAVLFTWVFARSGWTLPGQSPVRFAETVAADLAGALEREPGLDVTRYVHDQYARDTHPFFVMLTDGRVVTSGTGSFPEPLIRMARARLQRRLDRPEGDRFGRGDSRSFGRTDADRFGRGEADRGARDLGPMRMFRPPALFTRPVPVMVAGHLAGVVVVPPSAPFGFLLGRFAPVLGLAAAGVLVVGTALTSVLLFGPARQRLRQLEDADRARRQLLADVSHELTTPVTAMRGYLETLTMPELSLDDATRARYLTIISDETARLERIIGDLLDLARLEGGGGSLTIGPVPVAQLFARVVARHERACQTASVRMVEAIQPGAETVRGDRDRLEQALQNLAANAIRYAPPHTTVRLTARPSDGNVAIAVEDEGAGIDPAHLPHIFDRFYKADQARNGSGGSGLGLSIVKAIVERHGGRVTVDSRPGKTRFEIVLPRQAM